MDLATILSAAQTILTAIQTLHQLRDMFSFSHYEKELGCLLKTVNVVQSVLEDADAKHGALTRQQMNFIDELKDAVYDANDVLDEFVTLVKRKKLTKASHKLSHKVKSYLPNFTLLTHNWSKKIKEVNEKLDAIASNASKFMLDVNYKPIKFVKPETSSFVSPNDPIIGRDEELKMIIEMLLDSNDVNVLSVAIVGMGGLGKTAFAQLIYNNPRITSAFQLKCWTCIGDQEKDKWNLTYILGNILKELGRGNTRSLTSLQQIQQEVGKQLRGKKYFLVFDDVWIESRHKWQELEKFLMVGESGSRILVTTRSQRTAENIEGVRVHKLKGLSDVESWCLFKRMAFRSDQRENPDEDLVKVGKEIVRKCINVPLAIRIVGSLLYCQPEPKWLSFRDMELSNISKTDDSMNNILSLSYHQLDPPLKSCFAYCAIFPKDFEINKQQLIRLWMAQGYIPVEYEGEEYLRLLLQRCFFQDVMEDDIGEIESFKIHDLLHDIAEQASGREICKLNSELINVDDKVRHLTLFNDLRPQDTFQKIYIRTFFNVYTYGDLWLSSHASHKLLAGNSMKDWKCLRSLDLSRFHGKSLPKSIGKLVHLRCLDLSDSLDLKVLPNSITKLVNLQTLTLSGCESLTKLPEDLYKLVDLSSLDLDECYSLSHMPLNLGMLTNLHTLGLFVVGGAITSTVQCLDGLKVLRSLNNLKGSLHIFINVPENTNHNTEDHDGGDYLIRKQHLRKIVIQSYSDMLKDESIEWEQSLWEDMQPHFDTKRLSLRSYTGETMPRWPRREDNSTLFYFPNLVCLDIVGCLKLRVLPQLENLPRLKKLSLCALHNIEYIVNVNLLEARSLGEGSSFFPCLEQLELSLLHKLRGWWPGSEEQMEPFPCFPKLMHLKINRCKMLKFIPICLSLKSVWLFRSENEDLPVLAATIGKDNMEVLPESYQCLLPSDSKSRFITISDFESHLGM